MTVHVHGVIFLFFIYFFLFYFLRVHTNVRSTGVIKMKSCNERVSWC